MNIVKINIAFFYFNHFNFTVFFSGNYDITKEITHVLQDIPEDLKKKFGKKYMNKLYYSYVPDAYYDMIMFLEKKRKKQ